MTKPETGAPSEVFLLSCAMHNPRTGTLFNDGRYQARRAGEALRSHLPNEAVVILSSTQQRFVETAQVFADASPGFIYDADSNQRDFLDPGEYARDIADIRQRLMSTWPLLSACGLRNLLLVLDPQDMLKLAGVVRGSELTLDKRILQGELWRAQPGLVTKMMVHYESIVPG